MASKRSVFELDTRGECDVIDITGAVEEHVIDSAIESGTATVFVPGSTAAVTTIEYESGAVSDFKAAIERLAPTDIHYSHDARWGDGNGFSHVRAALLGPSMSVPFNSGRLLLGTWQQIVLVDFDNRPRHRKVIVQVLGD
jgi:secondary thiamine-phosphate synthase enzyme